MAKRETLWQRARTAIRVIAIRRECPCPRCGDIMRETVGWGENYLMCRKCQHTILKDDKT